MSVSRYRCNTQRHAYASSDERNSSAPGRDRHPRQAPKEGSSMSTSTAVRKGPVQHPGKEERARDAAQAVREYEAQKRVIDARTARLRALRLTKEAADALEKKPRRPVKENH